MNLFSCICYATSSTEYLLLYIDKTISVPKLLSMTELSYISQLLYLICSSKHF